MLKNDEKKKIVLLLFLIIFLSININVFAYQPTDENELSKVYVFKGGI